MPAALTVDGMTTLLTTSFEFFGEPPLVAAALTEVCHRLHGVRFEDVAHEAGILAAEQQFRQLSVLSDALQRRFGASGPGLAAYGEPGLGQVDADYLHEWVRRRFTVENAVLIVDGPDFRQRRWLPRLPQRKGLDEHVADQGHHDGQQESARPPVEDGGQGGEAVLREPEGRP